MPNTLLAIDVPGKYEGGYALRGTDGVVRLGQIKFDPKGAESVDYLLLAQVIGLARPQVVIMEMPFLYLIAQHIGGIKMYCALNGIKWWQVGASKAKKLVLHKGNATKTEVLTWATLEHGAPLSQHCADALMYLRAYQLTESGG